jgi:hypothetical protein
MNEIELIRAQLATERQHAAAVAKACASALSAALAQTGESLSALQSFRQAGVDYLVWILTRFEDREQVFRELVHSRLPADDPTRREVDATLALPGTSREVLAKLEAALASTSVAATSADADQPWHEFLRFFSGPWSGRRDELDMLFEGDAKVADWRAVSGIDADSIFEERSRYARVRSVLPVGIEIPAGTTRL